MATNGFQRERGHRNRSVDRGYAWVIVTSSFYFMCLYTGTLASYGILLPEYVEHFRVKKARVTVIQALNYCAASLTGVLVGWLIKKHGFRVIAVLGATCSSIGYIISSLVDTLEILYVSHGFLQGLGLVTYLVTATVAVTTYFEKKRTLALGITVTGLGFGLFIWAPFLRYLLNTYGRSGALLLCSTIHLNGIVAGSLLRPLQPSPDLEASTQPELARTERSNKDVEALNKPNSGDAQLRQSTCCYDITVPIFVISYTLNMTGHIIPYVYIPARAESLGITKENSAVLLSVLGVSGIIARPVFGYIGDKVSSHKMLLNGVTCVAVGVMTSVAEHLWSFVQFSSYLALQGIISGGYMATFAAVVADLVSMKDVAVVNGIMTTSTQGCNAAVMFLSGWLVDLTGTYGTPFLVFGLTQAVGGALAVLVYTIQVVRRRRQTQSQDNWHAVRQFTEGGT